MENTNQNTGIATMQPLSWTPEQVKLIKDTVAKGTTEDEFKLFLYTAKKYGFDPLIKKIWCIKYGTAPATIFTGRDGFLQKAHESGLFDGMKTTPHFDEMQKLISATCTVFRKDMKHPIEVTVWNKEYNTGKSNWGKMEITMLCKVAESQALRKAFDISGIYSEEEQNAVETNSVIDASHTEVLSEELQKQINESNSSDELKSIWEGNKNIQKKTYFVQAVNKRKMELLNPEPTKKEGNNE